MTKRQRRIKPLYTDLYAHSGDLTDADGKHTWTYFATIYEQPTVDRVKAFAMDYFDHVYHLGPWNHIDRFFERRHDRKCGGTCTTGFRRLADGTSKEIQICGYTPISVKIELEQYFVSNRNRRVLAEVPVDKTVWDRDATDGRA